MKFSVTIPTFKARYLSEAIQSVADQSYADWELIIVDDCSPEDIKSIVTPWLDDSRIRYYRNTKNCGALNVVDNWNICLSHCTGDYVICIGDDDKLLPCCLEEYNRLIEKYPALNVYHARTEIINERGELISLQEPRPEWESALSLIWNRWAYRPKQFIGDFCYNTQYLKNEGGYFKLPLAWGSDDITSVLAARSNGIANTQSFCFQYRDNGLTITSCSRYAEKKLEASLREYEWFTSFLREEANKALPPTDSAYIKTIEVHRQNYFKKEFGNDFIYGVKGNPFRIRHYYRKLKPLHYPTTTYVRWYITSLYHLFFK